MNILENVPLSKYTTFQIGGPADFLVKVSSKEELIEAVDWAKAKSIDWIVLGKGSNILVSDKGFRGLVIINKVSGWELIDGAKPKTDSLIKGQGRLKQIGGKVKLADIVYDESDSPKIKVKVYSGTVLSWFIQDLLNHGITGMQWFVAIPGTVGGAVYNNIHCGDFLFGQFVESVEVLKEDGEITIISGKDCDFSYDHSRFQKSKEVIISAKMDLYKGDVQKARDFIRNWASYKRSKNPLPSAGCVFKNLPEDIVEKHNLPTGSMGYFNDKVLGLKNTKIGGARISEKHSAFIVNDGGATAKDVLQLINLVKQKSQEKLGITPELEIFLIGF
jgi:UDP-N-acetylmuramate dehydrogenase